MLARTAAGVLSDHFETEVKIKTFYIKPNFKIYAEEVQFNDKKHLPMFYVGKMNARLSLKDVAKELRFKSLDVEDLLVSVVKYEGDDIEGLLEAIVEHYDSKLADGACIKLEVVMTFEPVKYDKFIKNITVPPYSPFIEPIKPFK